MDTFVSFRDPHLKLKTHKWNPLLDVYWFSSILVQNGFDLNDFRWGTSVKLHGPCWQIPEEQNSSAPAHNHIFSWLLQNWLPVQKRGRGTRRGGLSTCQYLEIRELYIYVKHLDCWSSLEKYERFGNTGSLFPCGNNNLSLPLVRKAATLQGDTGLYSPSSVLIHWFILSVRIRCLWPLA